MIAAMALMGLWPFHTLAQAEHLHAPAPPQKLTAAQQIQAQTLIDAVRSRPPFQERRRGHGRGLRAAVRLRQRLRPWRDWAPLGERLVSRRCVIDVQRPEIVLYEQPSDGSLLLTGADYLVYAACLGLEGQHKRDVHELESHRLM